VEFQVLGAVQARAGARSLDLGPARQQCVLVALLVDANRVVPVEQVLARVWNGDSARRATLYSYVSRLRVVLAGAGDVEIVRQSGGYRLAVDPGAVDLHRFRQLVAAARLARDDGEAAARYEEALGLWRGEAFAGLDTVWIDEMRTSLEEERRSAVRDRNDLMIGLGRHLEVLTELAANAAEHPLDERLAGQLMRALHRAGRRADALRAYQDVRAALVDALGLEPGAELQRLQQRILADHPDDEPAPGRAGDTVDVPRQLPPDVGRFTGREDQLARLHELCRPGAAGTRAPAVVAVDGTAGVGKTALVVHFAHRVVDGFPDGQLYLDLRGYAAAAPMTPVEALGQLLRGLGVAPERIPADEPELAARYRSVLAGKRVLIVLDNARADDQVRPLLPGTSDSTVLITSRRILSALDDVGHVHLDVLSVPDARELFADPLGGDRAAAEPAAVSAVVQMCARLPLALRLAGARIAARPAWTVATLAARLADEDRRLGELAVGDRAVRAGFAVGYEALGGGEDVVDRRAARLFRLLGAVQWVDLNVPVAAALLEADQREAEDALERLVDARMLDSVRPGRYHTHDLLRLYARELARADPAEHPGDALRRLLQCYLDAAGQANLLLNPVTRHRPDPPGRQLRGRFVLRTHADARAWVDAERQNLIAVARQALEGAGETGRLAVELTAALNRPFDLLGYWLDFAAVRELAAATANRIGDAAGAAFAWTDIGWSCVRLGDAERATASARRALAVWRETGDRRSEQACLNILGFALRQLGRISEALERLESAYAICCEIGHRYGQAATLNHMGLVHQRLSRFSDAMQCHSRALGINEELGDHSGQAVALANIGWARQRAGEPEEALAHFHRGQLLAHGVGDRYQEAEALWGLGDAQHSLGDRDKARAFWNRSLAILAEIGAIDAAEADVLRRRPVPDTPEIILHNT
jgi:DNA-binding SARP family transcriptional activator/Tfp pilus assembly protein PilF